MRDIFSRVRRSRRSVYGCITVMLLVLVTGCPGGEAEAPAPRAAATPQAPAAATRIAFLGDSLAAGYGLPEDAAFPALIGEELRRDGHPVEIINAGVSGDTSAGGLSRLDWVLRSRPEILVVELGGNDALRGQPLDQLESNLRAIVRKGREAGARVLLLGMNAPTSYGPQYVGEFVALYARIAREEQVEFVPEFIRDVALDPELMQPDGLHPTAEGHRRLAASLVPAVAELLGD